MARTKKDEAQVASEPDHAGEFRASRLAQIDARIADLDAERAQLQERRAAYGGE